MDITKDVNSPETEKRYHRDKEQHSTKKLTFAWDLVNSEQVLLLYSVEGYFSCPGLIFNHNSLCVIYV